MRSRIATLLCLFSLFIVAILARAEVRSGSANAVRTASRARTWALCSKIAPGTSLYVERTLKQPCRPRHTQRGHVAYQLTRLPDGSQDLIQVRLKLRMKIPSKVAASRRKEILQTTEACVPSLERVWHRYGVDLDLRLDSTNAPSAGSPDHFVALTDDSGRFYQDHYNYQGNVFQACTRSCGSNEPARRNCLDYCETQRQREFCAKMTHEVGHLLGLYDEYPDPACPSRPFVDLGFNPISVMSVTGLVEADQMDFHPRHIETVLGPVCH